MSRNEEHEAALESTGRTYSLGPSRRKADALHRSARQTAECIAKGWGPDDGYTVGVYDAPGAVIVFGHPPRGYFAVVWDESAYQAKANETRVGIWDGLFVVHGMG